MIGYYIHHQGHGHLARALSICGQLSHPVTALTSLTVPAPHPFAAVVKLPRDDEAEQVHEPTANGAFHWAPHQDNGFRSRMSAVASWVAATQPVAVAIDVSVEMAAFVRLLGVPVIVMALPGKRFDAPHALAHRLADHIIAAWPQELYVPAWLRPHAEKTSFVGGISSFDGRACPPSVPEAAADGPGAPVGLRVLVLGAGSECFGASITDCAAACPGTVWTTIGGTDGWWVDDPWPQICAADVVVTHAGQSVVADVAIAQRPAVVLPQPCPHDEQSSTATVLRQHRMATVATRRPDVRAWPGLLAQALATDPGKWSRWQVHGAASRAARAIEATAQCCTTVGAS